MPHPARGGWLFSAVTLDCKEDSSSVLNENRRPAPCFTELELHLVGMGRQSRYLVMSHGPSQGLPLGSFPLSSPPVASLTLHLFLLRNPGHPFLEMASLPKASEELLSPLPCLPPSGPVALSDRVFPPLLPAAPAPEKDHFLGGGCRRVGGGTVFWGAGMGGRTSRSPLKV